MGIEIDIVFLLLMSVSVFYGAIKTLSVYKPSHIGEALRSECGTSLFMSLVLSAHIGVYVGEFVGVGDWLTANMRWMLI